MVRSGRPRALPVVLALAILGISVSGPLAKLSAAPPLAIAVWRLALSMLIVALPLLAGGGWREWRALSRGDVALALAAGGFLALHFWSWIASLGMTSVAASVLLVNLHPVVIVLGGALWLRERPTRMQLLGVAIALLGAAIVVVAPASVCVAAGADASERVAERDHALRDLTSSRIVPSGVAALGSSLDSSRARLGNALALLGALTVGLYYPVGRRLRQRLSLWPYVALVYGACLLVLLGLAAWQRTPLWPQPPREIGIFALIALGPMLAGHTGFNWALRYVPAVVVSIALLAEPLGAALIAWALLGEAPSAAVAAGGAVVIAGLGIAMRARTEDEQERGAREGREGGGGGGGRE